MGVAPPNPTPDASDRGPRTHGASRPAAQQPAWPDEGALKQVHARLSGLPPLVFAGEARHLTRSLGQAAEGRAFVLQAGDCAESFSEFTADGIRDKLKVILQMAVVLTYGAGLPGDQGRPHRRAVRQAPQLAHRAVGDEVIDSFRGHMVNDDLPERSARVPDPEPAGHRLRAVGGHPQSAARLHQGRVRRPRARSTPGTRSSWPARPRAAASRTSPRASTAPCASWTPAASTSPPRTRSTRSTSGPATRRSSSTTRRR